MMCVYIYIYIYIIIIIEIGLGTSGTAVIERSYLLNALSAKVQRLQNVNVGTLSEDIA